jgi:hypothetical protein
MSDDTTAMSDQMFGGRLVGYFGADCPSGGKEPHVLAVCVSGVGIDWSTVRLPYPPDTETAFCAACAGKAIWL